jgi:hypothetical protein
LGTTAPDESVTEPKIVPKMVCPIPGVARHKAIARMLMVVTKGLNFMKAPDPRIGSPDTGENETGYIFPKRREEYSMCDGTVKSIKQAEGRPDVNFLSWDCAQRKYCRGSCP